MNVVLCSMAIGLVLLVSTTPVAALEIREAYRNGIELCAEYTKFELGTFLQVPVDYAQPEKGTTQVYFWTMEPLDRRKPSLIYFVGGPGGSNHGSDYLKPLLSDWNRIYFDQRGVSCSRPEGKSLLKSSNFFSSKNTALDANEIRKHLGLQRWSIYGQSYGTVPATIFAHMFPQHTIAVVLSGVVYEGSDELWLAPTRLQFLQKAFDNLTQPLRRKILNWSSLPGVPPYWFTSLGLQKMRGAFAEKAIKAQLDQFEKLREDELIEVLKDFGDSSLEDYEFGFSSWAWLHLNCQELGASSKKASNKAIFSGEVLEPLFDEVLSRECAKSSAAGISFLASNFPVTVPVTYILGENDGATPFNLAKKHWESVPQGFSQLLSAKEGGHSLLDAVIQSQAFKSIFENAVSGQQIGAHDLQTVESESELGWQLIYGH